MKKSSEKKKSEYVGVFFAVWGKNVAIYVNERSVLRT